MSDQVAGWVGDGFDREAVPALVGQLDIGVLVVDDDRRVVIVNQALLRLIGTDEDLLGRPARSWSALPGLRAFADCMETVGSGRTVPDDGPARQGTWHRVPGGLMLTVHDVTADARARQVSRRHNRAMAELAATKSDLVSSLLHELRTPLTTLASAVEYLPEPTPDTADVYELITRTTHRLRDVLAEVAMVADLESGGTALDAAPVDLGRLLTEVAADWHVVPVITGPQVVTGDGHWLRILLDRLVAVAATAADAAHGSSDGPRGGSSDGSSDGFSGGFSGGFSDGSDHDGVGTGDGAGRPDLPLTVTATGTAEDWTLWLPLADTGDRLYTRTGDRSNATALMIARAVVARHHGMLTVTSRDGRAELRATVPAVPPDDAPGPVG